MQASSTGGDFMPLSYWANMGLDANRIKEHTKPEDVQWSDQLGWTYRVIIKGSKRTVKKSQREVMTIVNARKRRGVAIEGPQPKATCVGEPTHVSGKPTRKPPSSSSSDSSSPDEDSANESEPEAQGVELSTPPVSGEPTLTRAAKAKAKAYAKAAAKAAAAKAKAQAKAATALKNRATALRRRLLLALNGLRSAISHPLMLEVPASMSEKAKSYLRAFERPRTYQYENI